jgi:DNA-binding NarL/FixJ family response regulator
VRELKVSIGQIHRVLVIDDQVLVRAGVSALVEGMPGHVCVGAAGNTAEGLHACLSLRPDLVLLDLHLPRSPREPTPDNSDLPGLDLLRALQAECPGTRVLVLSGRNDVDVVRTALRCGAAGFMCKDFVLDELSQALALVMRGHRWLSPSIAARLQAGEGQGAARLTPRQRDVLTHLARGRSNKEIARQLGVSVKTVEYHRSELINRLDLHDVASLTRFAVAQGLVS